MTNPKIIKVRPGKFITISPALAEKAAASLKDFGLTREQALASAKAEPRGATIFAGPVKPRGASRRGGSLTAGKKDSSRVKR